MDLPRIRPPMRLHFVGIAGAGMSSLAHFCVQAGFAVAGSDRAADGPQAHSLRDQGAIVYAGHDPAHVQGADVVVVSSAVSADNAEVRAAKDAGIAVLKRGEFLGALANDHPNTIAVCGTHGKGTTAGALVAMMEAAGWPVSWILGAPLRSTRTASRFVKDAHALVVEVDESDKTHLAHRPSHLLLTNLEADHLNNYGSLAALVESFEALICGQLKTGAHCVVGLYGDGIPPLLEAGARCGVEITTTSLDQSAHIQGHNLRLSLHTGAIEHLDIHHHQHPHAAFSIQNAALRGALNARNLLAASAMALALGVPPAAIQAAASHYDGLCDRFDERVIDDRLIVTDYTSHPTSIEGNLANLRARVKGRLYAVFQPFRYSLVSHFWDHYIAALRAADSAYILALDSGGEPPITNISSERLAALLGGLHFDDIPSLEAALQQALSPHDAVIIFGGGPLFGMAKQFKWY